MVVVFVCLSALLSIQEVAGDTSEAYLFTDQELDGLLAPIALYPDPLLAQILPASTYPQEVADAAAWLRNVGDLSGIDGQSWDDNVKAIAHYPGILYMMADDMGWTADLGDAFLNQPDDVTMSIQRLRWKAREEGNLESNNQQTVLIEGDYIEIIPAQPEYIYVPQYDPSAVYFERWTPDSPPFITFGLGLVIGTWLDMDFDWGHRRLIYHGWDRPGWVHKARPYVHIPNTYIQRNRPFIDQIWRHDPARGGPDRYRTIHRGDRFPRTPEVRGRGAAPAAPPAGKLGPTGNVRSLSNRGRESLETILQPAARRPAVKPQPAAPTPRVGGGISRPAPPRENIQPVSPPLSNLGGYRGGNEAIGQSLRGQSSRGSSEGVRPSPAPAPAARPGSRAIQRR